jgi:hypothetical protein
MLIIYAVMLVAGVGLIAKYGIDMYYDRTYEERPEGVGINWTEYVLGVVVMTVLFAAIIQPVGTNMARSNSLKFKEFWNGYEVGATHERIPCSRNGPCAHEYDCDPYTHVHTRTVSDGKTSRTETYTETHYNRCPYSTEEWTFRVHTTLGDYTISAHGFPDNPQEWRGGHGIPDGVFRGVPQFWTEANNRVNSGDPGPVTAIKTYDNYVLASQQTILKKYSGAIDRYQADGLMPEPANKISGYYYGDKVYFPGLRLNNTGAWHSAINRLNAALGMDLQGDLHFIATDSRKVKDHNEYAQALFAYWQSPKLGSKAASKNTIIVVVGTDGKTIQWAHADTGMPLGNEVVLAKLTSRLKHTEFTPDAVLGRPVGKLTQDGDDWNLKLRHGDGVVEEVLWGTPKFERVCMTCKDDAGKTGFTYLKDQIPLKSGQKVWIMVVSFFITLLVWGVMSAVDLKIPDVINIKLPNLKRGNGNNV